jgi:hypothetical protein
MGYKVKIREWKDGVLEVHTHDFPTYKEAHDFAKHHHQNYGLLTKIYNELDMLVHEFAQFVRELFTGSPY